MLQLIITIVGYFIFFMWGYAYCRKKLLQKSLRICQASKSSVEEKFASIRDIEFFYLNGIQTGACLIFDRKPELPDINKVLKNGAPKKEEQRVKLRPGRR